MTGNVTRSTVPRQSPRLGRSGREKIDWHRGPIAGKVAGWQSSGFGVFAAQRWRGWSSPPPTLAFATLSLASAACGSRTGLLDLEEDDVTPDASLEAGLEAGAEAGKEAGKDAGDAADVIVPVKSDCPDADATLVYVVTEQTEVLAFNPADASFRTLGHLDCPAPNANWEPFSMAVDREGHAYVLYNNIADEMAPGILYRVSLTTLACTTTAYRPGSTAGFTTFGMGFSTNLGGPTEQLYVAADDDPPRLGVIDTTTFQLTGVANLDPRVQRAELTGTGDGRLYGFFQPGLTAEVGQIDKTTGALTSVSSLPGVSQGAGWAFGFWGGEFYLFTSPTGFGSDITRFDPNDGSVTTIAHYSGTIVGAGVSTCAPEQ